MKTAILHEQIITEEQYKIVKRVYNRTLKLGGSSFKIPELFGDQELLMSYVKYMLEYLDAEFKKK